MESGSKILKIIFLIWVLLQVTLSCYSQKKQGSYLESPVIYPSRDSMVFSYAEKKIRMYGAAKVTYQDKEIQADYIEMSIDRKELYATGVKDSLGNLTGKPVFKDGDESYETTELRYNFETGKAWVMDVRVKEEEGFLHSHITKMDSTGTMNIKDGKYTTCDADHPHFHFQITKGKVIPDKLIVTGPLYLVVEDIPLPIGLPFGYLPKQQKNASGILMPSYGDDRERGFFLRNGGYYFSINDRYDLALTGDIYSRGSWKGSTQSRYRKIYKHSGSLNLDFATNKTGEKDINQKVQRDFSIRWNHSQDAKAHPYRTFNASVNLSTSKYDRLNTYQTQSNNFNDFNSQSLEHMTNTKSSSISYNRKFPNKLYNFTAKVGHTQNSSTRSIVLNAPSATFTVGRFYPFRAKSRVGKQRWYELIEMRYSSNFENRLKLHEDSIFSRDGQPASANMGNYISNNMQNGFKHQIPVSASFKPIKYMTMTPSLNYDGLLFFYQTEKHWDPELDSLIVNRINQMKYVQFLSPNLNLSYTPQIYGFFDFKRGRVKTIRHVMSPSLSFSYRPDLGYDLTKYQDSVQVDDRGTMRSYGAFDDGLYRLPSVAGRYGNISLNVGNQLEMKVKDPKDTTGQEKKVKLLESFSFGTSYDIFRDSMKLSPASLQARTRLFNQVNISFRANLNPYAIQEISSGNSTTFRTVDVFEISRSGKPFRMTDASLSVDFSLPFRSQDRSQGARADQRNADPGSAIEDYSIPWNLQIGYNFQYSKPYMDANVTQSLRISGNISLTPKWTVNLSSGYDFVRKEVTYTSLQINRNLHCWQMSINVVPFGQRKSYMFTIAANGSMLKDVKYTKNKYWSDNLY